MSPVKDRLGARLVVTDLFTDPGGALVDIELRGAQFDPDSFVQLRPPEARKLARQILAAADRTEHTNGEER